MRIKELDAMRGAVRIVVVLNHLCAVTFSLIDEQHWLWSYTPLGLIVSGRMPVLFFFILTGFVLGLMYSNGKRSPYFTTLLKRIVRIYVPYAAAILLAALACYQFNGQPAPWRGEVGAWSVPVSMDMLMAHLLLYGVGHESVSLSPPVWSLIIEMRIALVFPLLVWLVARFGGWSLLVGIPAGYACMKVSYALGGYYNMLVAQTALGSLLLTLYYIPYFMVGLWVAFRWESLRDKMLAVPLYWHWLVLAVLVGTPYAWLAPRLFTQDVMRAALALYLMLCCLSFPRVKRIMQWPLLVWAGRVSFSLYLVHVPVMVGVLYLTNGMAPYGLALILSLPLMALLSELLYHTVEKPSQALSRNIGKKQAG